MKPPQLCLLKLKAVPILQQLQIEEALLRADQRNWLIWNTESTPAIVLGISSKIEQMVNLERWSAQPVPLIRRFSGGGTVIIDHDTCFTTFIGNASELGVAPQTHAVHHWAASVFAALFPNHHNFKLRENDYVMGDRKCGGNAQYLSKNRWLHHTSFLWNYNPEQMQLLAIPPKMPDYRAKREHKDFVCTLNQIFTTKEEFQEKLVTELSSRFTLVNVEEKEVRPLLDKPHRKATLLL